MNCDFEDKGRSPAGESSEVDLQKCGSAFGDNSFTHT